MAKVLKKEDFPEPVAPIIMILMDGTSVDSFDGNVLNFFPYSTTIYKIEIIKETKESKCGRRNISHLKSKARTKSMLFFGLYVDDLQNMYKYVFMTS